MNDENYYKQYKEATRKVCDLYIHFLVHFYRILAIVGYMMLMTMIITWKKENSTVCLQQIKSKSNETQF